MSIACVHSTPGDTCTVCTHFDRWPIAGAYLVVNTDKDLCMYVFSMLAVIQKLLDCSYTSAKATVAIYMYPKNI